MEPYEIVAERFNHIIDNELYKNPMNKFDTAVWYITAARCEGDINGIESIFEQLFSEEQLIELELCLRSIHEEELATTFEQIRILLSENNFWNLDRMLINSLPIKVVGDYKKLEKLIDFENRMWDLDEKMVEILFQK